MFPIGPGMLSDAEKLYRILMYSFFFAKNSPLSRGWFPFQTSLKYIHKITRNRRWFLIISPQSIQNSPVLFWAQRGQIPPLSIF
jgi:hypothetical protein